MILGIITICDHLVSQPETDPEPQRLQEHPDAKAHSHESPGKQLLPAPQLRRAWPWASQADLMARRPSHWGVCAGHGPGWA